MNDLPDLEDLPEKFVPGKSGRSTYYHTRICRHVKSSIKNRERLKTTNMDRMSVATDNLIAYHDLEPCPACKQLENTD